MTWAIIMFHKISAIPVRLCLEHLSSQRRHPKLLLQQRQCRHQLHERRMFGIKTVVAAMPHHVAGKNMVALIESERLAMNDNRNQDYLQNDQAACKGPDRHFQSIHRPSVSMTMQFCSGGATSRSRANQGQISFTLGPILFLTA